MKEISKPVKFMIEDILDLLRRKNIENVERCFDVCCGQGKITRELSEIYPEVYGLDINRETLAYGIAKGNFKKAVPLHGDAFNLVKDDQDFDKVYLDSQNYKNGYVNWMKLQHEKLKHPLKNLDLVIAVNPNYYISSQNIASDHLYSRLSGKEIESSLVPVSVISPPLKKGGHLIYSVEVSNTNPVKRFVTGINPYPDEKQVNDLLEHLKNEGKVSDLKFIADTLIENNYEGTNLTVVFKK